MHIHAHIPYFGTWLQLDIASCQFRVHSISCGKRSPCVCLWLLWAASYFCSCMISECILRVVNGKTHTHDVAKFLNKNCSRGEQFYNSKDKFCVSIFHIKLFSCNEVFGCYIHFTHVFHFLSFFLLRSCSSRRLLFFFCVFFFFGVCLCVWERESDSCIWQNAMKAWWRRRAQSFGLCESFAAHIQVAIPTL